ncbi:helix-turn-helix transcriptional regulator [Nesterenkonia ebinurensis]|uniref:helix-turn-helix transcriptional regulator n=1 Tax=Nesterenkonia ebinurensis TaxID=2608252 RepID=UPI00123CCCFA|nr:WYL domain-containing protein [Nesterenkonia ebinurensis]
MRADRLVSLVLLLRQRGRLSASELAEELEVSTRTVQRDIEALSSAGVPVYAERGRHGGFALLPNFQTDLTGLNHEEAVALLVAGSRPGVQTLGLGPALASAMLKVIDALPTQHQSTATQVSQRFLIDPATDLLARPIAPEEVPNKISSEITRAVLAEHQLRIFYAAKNESPRWRTVNPIGLVTVRETGYLLATRDGNERTYRLSRISQAEALPQPTERTEDVDLEDLWQQHINQFRHNRQTNARVTVRVHPDHRSELTETALEIHSEELEPDKWLRVELTFHDHLHAEWALWRLGNLVEVLTPNDLKNSLYNRALAMTHQYTPGQSA